MFTTLPLEAFVCREVAETYFWPGEHEFNKKRHVIITSALVFSALLGASGSLFSVEGVETICFFHDLTKRAPLVMQSRSSRVTLVSSSNSLAASPRLRSHISSVSWGGPKEWRVLKRIQLTRSSSRPIAAAACFLKLSGSGEQLRPQRLAAWACAGFGILVMVLSTVLSIRKALQGGSHKQC